MEVIGLSASLRTVTGKKVGALRREGLIPAVMYGSGTESVSIQLSAHETSRALMAVGGSTLIDLKIGDDTHKVLLREIQRHVIRRNILHIDFLKVAMDEAIRAVVPIDLIGIAPAVRDLGGVLVTGLDEIEVEALPADLPDRITIDLGALLTLDDSITVRDLQFSEGVTLLTDPDESIANVVHQMAEEIVEVEEVEILGEPGEPELVERGEREADEGEEEE